MFTAVSKDDHYILILEVASHEILVYIEQPLNNLSKISKNGSLNTSLTALKIGITSVFQLRSDLLTCFINVSILLTVFFNQL